MTILRLISRAMITPFLISLASRLPIFLTFASSNTIFAEEPDARSPVVVSPEALRIHRSAPVFDGHNDLPWAVRKSDKKLSAYNLRNEQPGFHTDIPRLRRGGVGAQFWSVYVPVSTSSQNAALTTTLEQIQLVHDLAELYDDVFELAMTTADIERIQGEGKIASLIGVEGGHSIENSINVLRELYRQGARYMTLTHSMSLDWADSCSDDSRADGLSNFGVEVVKEMNRLGMVVDLSHVSVDCMRKALAVSQAPVMFSHSSAKALANHPRNVPDEILKLTGENGGVVMVNFFPDFVHPTDVSRSLERTQLRDTLSQKYPNDDEKADAELRQWELKNPRSKLCTVHTLVDHIENFIKIAGVDHVGIGSDYDGVPALPKQLEDVSTYPVITQALLDRGYTEQDIRKILGGNMIRVLRNVEKISRSMKKK
ncbi:MAG: dipeptidase [Planctomycetota bacterium]|nr:dipeptidase [Planctomycetota bacterium]